MFKNNKNSSRSSIEDRVKFLDISNVSKSPLRDIKNLWNLEKSFAIGHGADLIIKDVMGADEELVNRRIFEDFDLIDLRVEGFFNKYLRF